MPSRYNLRKRGSRTTTWVKDETLNEPDSESEDDDYVPPSEEEPSEDCTLVDEDEEEDDEMEEESEEEQGQSIVLPKGAKISVKLHIHTAVSDSTKIVMEDSEEESEEEEEESDDESEESEVEMMDKRRKSHADFMNHLMSKYVPQSKVGRKRRERKEKESLVPAMELNDDEEEYYDDLPKSERRRLNEKMARLAGLVDEGDVPFKFRVLDLEIADSVKASVIKKIDILSEMSMEGEGYKLRSWVESFLRVPFGKVVPLPVTIKDGPESCSKFLSESTEIMDKAVYGMTSAKTQIMQILAQWISNPTSIGNVIALKGPMGVGKTSFARHGVAKALKRPFEFFSLGGASDASNFVGHSYTYEGSTWGRIADALMTARCMNPVLYFDEVDKISTTAHGDEITSMLIHLTDRSQNSCFHDRYFSGVDFDLSQCLFVFSFNDESKIHPVLKDRMQVINCSGYTAAEKASIVNQYVWPQILDHIQLKDQLSLSPEAIKYLIAEYSNEEEGVRTLIRTVETLVTRINLLRIADEKTAKGYVFYKAITLPLTITPELAKHILQDTSRPINESYKHLYT